MLLVVDTLCPCGSKQLSIVPQEVADEKECDFKYDNLYRRKLSKCMNYHPEVRLFKEKYCTGWPKSQLQENQNLFEYKIINGLQK